MELRKLGIDGALLGYSPLHIDDRGYFREWFKHENLTQSKSESFEVAQANVSLSKENVLRGIHFSTKPTGQEKWITCTRGSILDYVIDIRVSSPTFKQWITVELNEFNGCSIFVGNGLGHAFIAQEDKTQVNYLLTAEYNPEFEKSINPFDPDLGIDWGENQLILSQKDRSAPSLEDLRENGYLPK